VTQLTVILLNDLDSKSKSTLNTSVCRDHRSTLVPAAHTLIARRNNT